MLCGCAGISSEDRAALRRVSVAPQLQKRPLEAYFQDRALLDGSFRRVTQLTLAKILSDL
jgi:hypothetical protein